MGWCRGQTEWRLWILVEILKRYLEPVKFRDRCIECQIILTCDAHPVAVIQRIPHHWPVGDWYQCFWKCCRVGCECVERCAGSAEDQGLEARLRESGVRHFEDISPTRLWNLLEKIGLVCDINLLGVDCLYRRRFRRSR